MVFPATGCFRFLIPLRPRKTPIIMPQHIAIALDTLADDSLNLNSVKATRPGTLDRLRAVKAYIVRELEDIFGWSLDRASEMFHTWVRTSRSAVGLFTPATFSV